MYIAYLFCLAIVTLLRITFSLYRTYSLYISTLLTLNLVTRILLSKGDSRFEIIKTSHFRLTGKTVCVLVSSKQFIIVDTSLFYRKLYDIHCSTYDSEFRVSKHQPKIFYYVISQNFQGLTTILLMNN